MELCEDSPLTTAVAETSSTWPETVEKVEEIKGKKREETEVSSKEEEHLLSLRNLLPYWQAWRDFAQAEKTARHAALQTLLRDSFCGWHDLAATEKAARNMFNAVDH
eukprot:g16627.t1